MTHVAAPSLKRVAKVLAAMAAGAWIVSTDFLTASHAAHALVEPVLPSLLQSAQVAQFLHAVNVLWSRDGRNHRI